MKIGNLDITNPKIGTTAVSKVFIGIDQVWPNFLTGSTGSFSLRLLSSFYLGNAIQVRRASDNTTQDIGFISGQLDVTSLNTFCSGTNGFVSVWYNQSDASNNAIQTTSANQPKIYDSVTGVELENGKPTIKFIKSSSTWLEVIDTSFGNIGDVISFFSVCKLNSSNTNYPTLISKSYSEIGSASVYFQNTTEELRIWFNTGRNATSYTTFLGSQRLLSFINLLGVNGNKVYIDGSLVSQKSVNENSGSNIKKWAIGRNNRDSSYYWDGNIQELILYSSDQTAHKLKIETNINTNYTIY